MVSAARKRGAAKGWGLRRRNAVHCRTTLSTGRTGLARKQGFLTTSPARLAPRSQLAPAQGVQSRQRGGRSRPLEAGPPDTQGTGDNDPEREHQAAPGSEPVGPTEPGRCGNPPPDDRARQRSSGTDRHQSGRLRPDGAAPRAHFPAISTGETGRPSCPLGSPLPSASNMLTRFIGERFLPSGDEGQPAARGDPGKCQQLSRCTPLRRHWRC